jgi:hypothetical protein
VDVISQVSASHGNAITVHRLADGVVTFSSISHGLLEETNTVSNAFGFLVMLLTEHFHPYGQLENGSSPL